ncbi:MAG TPA: outer membrane lipoprotein carrier protein LolA [Vicinamibacterales bacterium]|jgi:outer membrane lipoprotein carrier protein|nr:outer membrane lipoprotein carrier protein LolA [Vicinamibacterales bacterium]
MRLGVTALLLAGHILGAHVWLEAQNAAPAAPGADALARALQQRYQTIKDFSADFVHTYRGGVLRTQTRERGTVKIKKPGKMRWVYTAPEQKEFVSDGVKIYSHIPQDRQVLVSDVPPDSDASTPAMFLSGKGDIARDFTASLVESPVPDSVGLKLTPKRPEAQYDYFIVATTQPGLQIRALATHDRQGGDSVIAFMNLKENQGIPDKEFAFRIPKGADVITNTGN